MLREITVQAPRLLRLISAAAILVATFGEHVSPVLAQGPPSGSPGAGGPPAVTSISAGDGLIGIPVNPITSTGTLSVNFAGTGSAISAARSDHDHNGQYLPLSLLPSLAGFKVHVSEAFNFITIPVTSDRDLIHTITFTPTNTNDAILGVVLEGVYSKVSGEQRRSLSLELEVIDSSGVSIGPQWAREHPNRFNNAGSGLPFRKHELGFALGGAPPYTINLYAYASPDWVGQLDSLQYKVITLENAAIISPSPNFSH